MKLVGSIFTFLFSLAWLVAIHVIIDIEDGFSLFGVIVISVGMIGGVGFLVMSTIELFLNVKNIWIGKK